MKAASSESQPVRASSSAGAPVASTRPASIAISQSKRCASSMYAVATITLIAGRSERMRAIRSQNCARASGSTPVVGSSRISRSGSWISAQHRPSFCFIPPESLPAGRDRNAKRPVLRVSASIRRRRSSASWPNRRAKNCRFSSTESVGYRFLPSPCGMYAMRRHTRSRWRRERMSPPSASTAPVCSARAPAASASRLDLPTPSGPISPIVRPAGISSVIRSSATVLP